MRLGVFGGSFDPVHIGHLVAASHAGRICDLDSVLLVVANQAWQKSGSEFLLSAERRFELVSAAVAGHDGLAASRMEIDRGGLTYTIDTLRELDDDELFLIVGSDTAANIESWREWEAVAQLADLVIVSRPGVAEPALSSSWRVHHVEIPGIGVSSTDLRRRLKLGDPVDFLIPDRCLELLVAYGIYPGPSDTF